MIPGISFCHRCDSRADAKVDDLHLCSDCWFNVYVKRSDWYGQSERLDDRNGRGRIGHDVVGMDGKAW